MNASVASSPTLSPALLFGWFLLTAVIGGYAAHFAHAPRVIGYLLGGVLLRLILGEVYAPGEHGESDPLATAFEPVGAIKELTLGIILFTIGSIFERSRLKGMAPRMLRIGLCESLSTCVLVLVGCSLVALMALTQTDREQALVLALLLACGAIATAPAATLMVLQEYESKGPVTDTILGVTGMNNILCIVVFYAVFLILGSVGLVQTSGPVSAHLWLNLLVLSVGSALLGVCCGTLLSILHARLSLAETLLVFFMLFILLGEGEGVLQARIGVTYNFLLTTLCTGAVFANLAIDSQKLEQALRTMGAPLFACFFVMAGYELHLRDFLHMGWLGAAYVIFRVTGKLLGCALGVRLAGEPHVRPWQLGSALLCQAAVVIGLASFIDRAWDSRLASTFSAIILGSVVVFELIGPMLVKRCVVQGGEVKASTLLRGAGDRSDRGSIVPVTLRSLLRMFGLGGRAATSGVERMSVQHIMRSNVQLIPASAAFDEVLQFIERSTHSHFPVVDDEGNFAGMIHFSDVRDVIYDPAILELVTALDIADPTNVLVSMDLELDALLERFRQHNVAVLPVAESASRNRVVGLVEQRDLLRALRKKTRGRTSNGQNGAH